MSYKPGICNNLNVYQAYFFRLFKGNKYKCMKKFVVVDLFICFFFVANAQYATLYPANWYIGMKWNKVQVIVKSNDSLLHHQQVQINYPGVQLKKSSFI